MLRRAAFALGLAALLALAGLAFAWGGSALCHPEALPGDEAWHRRWLLAEALRGLTGPSPDCWLQSAGGESLAWAGRGLIWLAALLLILAALWEAFGWRLRLFWLAQRGGHQILAGPPALTAMATGRGPRLWLVGSAADQRTHLEHNPWRHVIRLETPEQAAAAASRIGAGRARRLMASDDNDLWNLALSEAALKLGPPGEIALRVENPVLRSLADERIGGREGVTLLSLTRSRQREGLALAMPGRWRDPLAGRPHLALIGGGEGFDQLLRRLAGQGYGLEREPPLISLLLLGEAAGEAARLCAMIPGDCAELRLISLDFSDAGALDEALTGLAIGADPLTALYCWHAGGAAGLIAARAEQVLLLLNLPVPPIVAWSGEPDAGVSGMIRSVPPLLPGEAVALSQRQDRHARMLHEAWIGPQRLARGAAFGSYASERDWADLPERLREDNRASADHLSYKLALTGRAICPLAPDADFDGPDTAEVARLAPVEHARWYAARRAQGWSPGPRDDARRRHPDLVPFAALDAGARAKDEAAIRLMSAALRLSGEHAPRETPVRSPDATGTPGLPLFRCAPLTEGFEPAEAALRAGLSLAVTLPRALPPGTDRPRLAALLARAWRIDIAPTNDCEAP